MPRLRRLLDEGPRAPEVPRRFKAMAILGWIVVAAASYAVAHVAHWNALTEGVRPAIFLLVGIPYFAVVTVIALVRFPQSGGDADADGGSSSSGAQPPSTTKS